MCKLQTLKPDQTWCKYLTLTLMFQQLQAGLWTSIGGLFLMKLVPEASVKTSSDVRLPLRRHSDVCLFISVSNIAAYEQCLMSQRRCQSPASHSSALLTFYWVTESEEGVSHTVWALLSKASFNYFPRLLHHLCPAEQPDVGPTRLLRPLASCWDYPETSPGISSYPEGRICISLQDQSSFPLFFVLFCCVKPLLFAARSTNQGVWSAPSLKLKFRLWNILFDQTFLFFNSAIGEKKHVEVNWI